MNLCRYFGTAFATGNCSTKPDNLFSNLVIMGLPDGFIWVFGIFYIRARGYFAHVLAA